MKSTIANRTASIVAPGMIASGVVISGLILLASCPPAPIPPGGGGPSGPGGASGRVDPYTCGNYAATDLGRKIQAFLEATVLLEKTVSNTENYARQTCVLMGGQLGMNPVQLAGGLNEVCSGVSNSLKEHLSVGIKAEAELDIDFEPAVCTVSVDAAARAAAECQARAESEVAVQCSGTCQGACRGDCSGICDSTGADGSCNGSCEGLCEGACSGSCDGYAYVDADASCTANAEIYANVEAQCTEPKVTVNYDAGIAVDATKLALAVKAIESGLPRLLILKAKVEGPVAAAFTTWGKSVDELRRASENFFASLGDQALCVIGQIQSAFDLLASLTTRLKVQVEVSVEVSASVGATI